MKTIIEIRAAEGGLDSKLLVKDQYTIYYKTAKINNLWLNLIEESPGYISFSVEGKNSYEIFKNESGGIRWIRTPPTEKRGRTHTSIVTVAVLKIPEIHEYNLKESEVEFRFIRASTSGGQKANKTECGVIAKHIPTGTEAKSISDRSQHANKILAIDVLKSRLFQEEQSKINSNTNYERSNQIGSGHRSDKTRTIRVADNIVKCEITGKTISLNSYLKGNINF